MNTGLKILLALLVVVVLVAIVFGIWANYTESGIRTIETWKTNLHKAKDDTNYDTRKQVEDTCRAMMAEYKTDIDRYNLYKNSEDKEKQNWADESYLRACSTVNKYNEYILKNSFVWENNIPDDIAKELTKPER